MIFESIHHDGRTYLNADVAFLRERTVPESVIVAAASAKLSIEIDARAEAIRSRYITPGFGQAMEYQETQVQAFDALARPEEATADRYPMLAATVGIDVDPQTGAKAVDVLGVARSIRAAYGAWSQIGAAIRGARMAGKAAVAAAATFEDATAAAEAIDWPE